MGLIDTAAGFARRKRYAWGWRVRYWYMDTRSGRFAQVASVVLAVLVLVLQTVRMALAAHQALQQDVAQQQLGYWWIVQLVILVVAAAWAYSQRPKPQAPKEQEIETPLVADGAAAKDYFGTCWIDYNDKTLLAWKLVGRDAIYARSGKK